MNRAQNIAQLFSKGFSLRDAWQATVTTARIFKFVRYALNRFSTH